MAYKSIFDTQSNTPTTTPTKVAPVASSGYKSIFDTQPIQPIKLSSAPVAPQATLTPQIKIPTFVNPATLDQSKQPKLSSLNPADYPTPQISAPPPLDMTPNNITGNKATGLVNATQYLDPKTGTITTPPPTPHLTLWGSIKDTMSNLYTGTIKAVSDIASDPLNLKTQDSMGNDLGKFYGNLFQKAYEPISHMFDFLDLEGESAKMTAAGKFDTTGMTPEQISNKAFTNYQDISNQGMTASKYVNDFSNTVQGIVGSLITMSGIPSALNVAAQLPVVGTLSKIISTAFTALDESGKVVSKGIIDPYLIDNLPISEDSKTNLKTTSDNLTGFVYQFIGPVALHELSTKVVDSGVIEKIQQKVTKDIITQYNLPKTVYINGTQIRDIWQTGKKLTPEISKLFTDLDLTVEQRRAAMQNGISITVPMEKVVSITDKPYWAKVKDLFKVPETQPDVRTSTFKDEKPTVAPRGLLSEPKLNPDILNTIDSNIKNYQSMGGAGVGTETPNASLRDLAKVSDTPEATSLAQSGLSKAITAGEITPNKDGTISVRRTGDISNKNDLVSITYDKTGSGFIDSTGKAPVYDFNIKQADIKYFIGGPEKELLIPKDVAMKATTSTPTAKVEPIAKVSTTTKNIKVLDSNGERITDIGGKNYPVNPDGTITVYHETATPKTFKKGIDNGKEIYFTNNPKGVGGGTIESPKDSTVLSFNIDPKKLQNTDLTSVETSKNEQWFKANAEDLKGIKINKTTTIKANIKDDGQIIKEALTKNKKSPFLKNEVLLKSSKDNQWFDTKNDSNKVLTRNQLKVGQIVSTSLYGSNPYVITEIIKPGEFKAISESDLLKQSKKVINNKVQSVPKEIVKARIQEKNTIYRGQDKPGAVSTNKNDNIGDPLKDLFPKSVFATNNIEYAKQYGENIVKIDSSKLKFLDLDNPKTNFEKEIAAKINGHINDENALSTKEGQIIANELEKNGYAGIKRIYDNKDNTVEYIQIKPTEPPKPQVKVEAKTESKYLYHGTKTSLDSKIGKEGLMGSGGGSSWSTNSEYSKDFGGSIYRVAKTDVNNQIYEGPGGGVSATGDETYKMVKGAVKPENLEVSHDGGKTWNKVKQTEPIQPEKKTSGLAKSINQLLLEKKIISHSGELSKYQNSTITEQSKLATDFVNEGPVAFRPALRGEVDLPGRLKPGNFALGVVKYLKLNPNPDVAYELLNSPLLSEVSEAGSTLGLLQNREQDSLTSVANDIRKAREAKLGDKTTIAAKKRLAVKDIVKEQQKVNLSKDEMKWDNFIDNIKTC